MLHQEYGDQPEIYRCVLMAHDYLFFTTVGVRDTSPSQLIGNYALIYAINRLAQIHRTASTTKPHYEEDFGKVRMYCTPASQPSSSAEAKPKICGTTLHWPNSPPVYFTYNSVNTLTQLTEEARGNFPTYGKKGKFPPLNSYVFFAIGGQPSGVVRLGKKQVPCRIHAEKLTVKGEDDGEFVPSHPVNPFDLEGGAKSIVSGELIMAGYPILINAILRGKHYICINSHENRYTIAKPDPAKYSAVTL